MTQALTESLTEAAQAAAIADHLERERDAWNSATPIGNEARVTHRDGLDWNGFRDAYYPDSRRHDFKAIVDYGIYRRSLLAAQPSEPSSPSE
jgi:hypothetical protein